LRFSKIPKLPKDGSQKEVKKDELMPREPMRRTNFGRNLFKNEVKSPNEGQRGIF